ncbi:MAG: ComF family protein [Nitrospiraceae bacterium]|nr:ComF family protein [Nitrospiraceae bacterium]
MPALFGRFVNFLLPARCAYCRSSLEDLSKPFFCSQCWSDFSAVPQPACLLCGRPFGTPEATTHSPGHACWICRKNPPAFDQAVAAGVFEGSLREAIHIYKYRPLRGLGRPLGRWMAGSLQIVKHIDLAVPVPLHRTRLRQRGFNQALLLAREVSDHFGIRLCYDNLIRLRPTRPQVELSGLDRTANVRDAFGLGRPSAVEGKSVLVIDDVFTTGATMHECSRVLKEAGASSVTALTLARAVD